MLQPKFEYPAQLYLWAQLPVNDCVIARGEVVVVDGNYGVRINQLASREDRLRTGMAEAGQKRL